MHGRTEVFNHAPHEPCISFRNLKAGSWICNSRPEFYSIISEEVASQMFGRCNVKSGSQPGQKFRFSVNAGVCSSGGVEMVCGHDGESKILISEPHHIHMLRS